MCLAEIRIQNYRTIVDLKIKFPHYYTAICGKNDAGKSNIVRLLRNSFQRPDRVVFFSSGDDLSIKSDFTKWREKELAQADRFIHVDFVLEVSRQDDEGVYRFLQDYLSLSTQITDSGLLEITVSVRKTAEDKPDEVGISINQTPYEILKAQESLQTSPLIFDNAL